MIVFVRQRVTSEEQLLKRRTAGEGVDGCAQILRDIQAGECAAPSTVVSCGHEVCGAKGSSSLSQSLASAVSPSGVSTTTTPPTSPVLSFADKGVPGEDTGAPLTGLVETGALDWTHILDARQLNSYKCWFSPELPPRPSSFSFHISPGALKCLPRFQQPTTA